MNWHDPVIVLTLIASVLSLVVGLCNLRRVELPEVYSYSESYPKSSSNRNDHVRAVRFGVTNNSNWLINSIRIQNTKERWLARCGDQIRSKHGEFRGFSRDGDWMHQIDFSPPLGITTDDLYVCLHSDAPPCLVLKFGVEMKGNPRVERTVIVYSLSR